MRPKRSARPARSAPHQSAANAAAARLPRLRSAARNLLIRALRCRQTTRAFSDRALSPEVLSELLWAAFGVNREHGPFGGVGRTAASASNSQEIDLYVALADGTYRYDAPQHRLELVVPEDLRRLAISRGQSPADPGASAPVRLIYVADVDRLVHTRGLQEPGLRDPDLQRSYYYVDTGLIAANVYLFAAAAGLGAWFHNCDRQGLAARLPLEAGQRVLFAQTVGYPPRRPRVARR
ncbi:MAG: nitroreductase family protein [Steroidobacteraceae bacterium]